MSNTTSTGIKTKYTFHHEFRRNVSEAKDYTEFLRLFGPDATKLAEMYGNVEFSVSGYGQDARELYDIPEVMTFLRGLDAAWPYAFFFLKTRASPINGFTLSEYFVYLNCTGSNNGQLEFTSPKREQFERWVRGLNEMSAKAGFFASRVNKRTQECCEQISTNLAKSPMFSTKPIESWMLKA